MKKLKYENIYLIIMILIAISTLFSKDMTLLEKTIEITLDLVIGVLVRLFLKGVRKGDY